MSFANWRIAMTDTLSRCCDMCGRGSGFFARVAGRGTQTAPPAQSPDPCELAGDVAGRSLPTLQQNSTNTPDNGRGHPALRPGAWRGGAERVGEPGAPVAL